MWNPVTASLVITSISSETKNQAMPKVRMARGSVTSRSSGFSIVLRTPNTAAANSRSPGLATVTPASTPATIASTSAFVSHETATRTGSDGGSLWRAALAMMGRLVDRACGRGDLDRLPVDRGNQVPGRLRVALDIEQALVVERRVGERVAAAEAGEGNAVLEQEVDRAREPRLRGEDAQVVPRCIGLELVGPVLLDRSVAVAVEPELGQEQGLLRIARSDGVEERPQRLAVGG